MQDKACCLEELEAVIQQLVRLMHLFERDQIEAREFSSAQFYTLLSIRRNPGITIGELSDRLFTATSTTSRVVDKLVRQGYVQRSEAPSDRRAVLLTLTDAGTTAITELQEQVSSYYQDILEHIPAGNIESTLTCVRTLLNAFEKANPSCC